jgi:NhaP-type Na+/H+ or K+/H+ antiporter
MTTFQLASVHIATALSLVVFSIVLQGSSLELYFKQRGRSGLSCAILVRRSTKRLCAMQHDIEHRTVHWNLC